GNPMICRIAKEVIDMIKEEKLVERARVLGSRVMQRLKSWVRKFNIVGDVRGLGLMIGIDIVKSKETKERGYNEAKKVVWRSYELGVIVNFVHGNVIRIQPPLNIDEDTLNRALDLLEEALEDVDEGRVSDDVIKYVEGW
ncbi:MAG TPA: aminotransferase class III-fold pyridoxal phosphate-dependent enzyme, partial [Acidilobales archaeon]|nr:aminotransferase class III-fold pyridoxal phosphate-dependent enzyme [Acidilobales archaeon]